MVNSAVIGINTEGKFVVVFRDGEDYTIRNMGSSEIVRVDRVFLNGSEIREKVNFSNITGTVLDSLKDNMDLLNSAEITDTFEDGSEFIVCVEVRKRPETYSEYCENSEEQLVGWCSDTDITAISVSFPIK